MKIYLLEAQNRLYYACFYIVKALFLFDKNKLVIKKHNNLLGLFNLEYIHNKKEFEPIFYAIYDRASKRREKADYDKFISFNKDEVLDNYNTYIKPFSILRKKIRLLSFLGKNGF